MQSFGYPLNCRVKGRSNPIIQPTSRVLIADGIVPVVFERRGGGGRNHVSLRGKFLALLGLLDAHVGEY